MAMLLRSNGCEPWLNAEDLLLCRWAPLPLQDHLAAAGLNWRHLHVDRSLKRIGGDGLDGCSLAGCRRLDQKRALCLVRKWSRNSLIADQFPALLTKRIQGSRYIALRDAAVCVHVEDLVLPPDSGVRGFRRLL